MGKMKKTLRPIVKKFREMKVEKVAPSHCTGENAVELFKEEYREDFIELKGGMSLNI